MFKKDSEEANLVISNAEEKFVQLCKANSVKYETKKFYEYQAIFFNGALCALDFIPVKWEIGLMVARPIVSKF